MCIARGLLVSDERAAWLVFGAGLLSWFGGEVYWSAELADLESPPFPSVADALYLGYYPGVFAALVLLLRTRVRRFHRSLWLDGALGGAAIAMVGAAVLFDRVLATTEGSAGAVATNLAYPLGDILMLGFVAGIVALNGWRFDARWTLLASGLAIGAVVDGIYLYQAAEGTYSEGTLLDSMWPLAALTVAAAAARPPRPAPLARLEGWRMLVVPSLATLAAVVVLVAAQLTQIGWTAVVLAALTLALGVARMAMTYGENLRMLDHSRVEALTDGLTGLGNRRRLMQDLEREIAAATPERPCMLVLFDLDGFKHYNDAFGHPAGDALLVRLGMQLAASVRPYGETYRMGGDEFCALVTSFGPGRESILASAAAALSEHGEGFTVGVSYGVVMAPSERRDAAEALQLADERMYADKGGGRASAGRQTRDVLLAILSEREPDLHVHLRGVAELAVGVARRLGLAAEDLDEVRRAAELHDIGKMAVPDAILHKPGPLTEDELVFIHQHTIVGERILGVAPALRPVGRLVRASHERWDGQGYPDRLGGEEIPLGARIIAVADAYDAMVSDRPYRAAMSSAEALDELRRCAGSQFDPIVVMAFCEEVTDRTAGGEDPYPPLETPAPARLQRADGEDATP